MHPEEPLRQPLLDSLLDLKPLRNQTASTEPNISLNDKDQYTLNFVFYSVFYFFLASVDLLQWIFPFQVHKLFCWWGVGTMFIKLNHLILISFINFSKKRVCFFIDRYEL